MPTLYEILNVDPFDSETNISEAADRLIAEWDPDPFDDRKARAVVAAVMREIIDARDTLTDPQKRQEYDVRIGLADVVYKNYELDEELPVSSAGNVKMMSYLHGKPCHKVGKEHFNQHLDNRASGPVLQNTIISFSSDYEPLTSSDISQCVCETGKEQERSSRKFSKPVIKVSQTVNGVEKITEIQPVDRVGLTVCDGYTPKLPTEYKTKIKTKQKDISYEPMKPEKKAHQYLKEVQPIISTEYYPISKKEILKRTKEIESVIAEDASIKTDKKTSMSLKHSKSIQVEPEKIIGKEAQEESDGQISTDETQKVGKFRKTKQQYIPEQFWKKALSLNQKFQGKSSLPQEIAEALKEIKPTISTDHFVEKETKIPEDIIKPTVPVDHLVEEKKSVPLDEKVRPIISSSEYSPEMEELSKIPEEITQKISKNVEEEILKDKIHKPTISTDHLLKKKTISDEKVPITISSEYLSEIPEVSEKIPSTIASKELIKQEEKSLKELEVMQPTDHLVKIEKKILEEKKVSPPITSESLPEIAEDTRKISISKIISESEKENLKDLKISQPTISTDHLAKVEKKDSEQQKIVSKEIDHLIKDETRPPVLPEKYVDAQEKALEDLKEVPSTISTDHVEKISTEKIAKPTISSEYFPEIAEEISEVSETISEIVPDTEGEISKGLKKLQPTISTDHLMKKEKIVSQEQVHPRISSKYLPEITDEISETKTIEPSVDSKTSLKPEEETSTVPFTISTDHMLKLKKKISEEKKTPPVLLETEIEDVSKERLPKESSVDVLVPEDKIVKDLKLVEPTISTDHLVKMEEKTSQEKEITPTFSSEPFQEIKGEISVVSKQILPIITSKIISKPAEKISEDTKEVKQPRISVEKRESVEKLKPAVSSEYFPEIEKDFLEPKVKAVKDSKSIETTISTDHLVKMKKKTPQEKKIAPTFSEHFQEIKKEILAESKETLPIMPPKKILKTKEKISDDIKEVKDPKISVEKEESEEKLKPTISSEYFPEIEKEHLKNLQKTFHLTTWRRYKTRSEIFGRIKKYSTYYIHRSSGRIR
ncbi:j domain-containing protein [Caerostris darwini]|uniref:J domain-containing protein n=1 Tax=Caerostris darwini TaxID=1538125 RepID=A0AAV4N8T5_9ARAC|nr:j domain-containing protein [Caerostris darwini]